MIPAYMSDSVAKRMMEIAGVWKPSDDRFRHTGECRTINPATVPECEPPAPLLPVVRESYAPTPKPDRAPKKLANTDSLKRPGRIAVEVMDPATCDHFQNGKGLWYKNGLSKSGDQKVICPACKRESRMVDGVVLNPGPYVPKRVACPPPDLEGFMEMFAAERGCTKDEIIGPSRLSRIVGVRRELAGILNDKYLMSNRQIGVVINKDSASVQYLVATRCGKDRFEGCKATDIIGAKPAKAGGIHQEVLL